MTLAASMDIPAMLASAKDAYQDGRLEDCRRFLMDVLGASPKNPEAREFAMRVFPEILESLEPVRALEVDAWSSSDLLDADWGEAIGGQPAEAERQAFEMAPPDGIALELEDPACEEHEEAPALEAVEAPAPEQVEAPALEAVEAPAPEQIEAPALEAVEAPAPEQIEAPAPEQVEAPALEAVEAPAPEQVDAPPPAPPPSIDESGWAIDSDWASSFESRPGEASVHPDLSTPVIVAGQGSSPTGSGNPPPAPGLDLLWQPPEAQAEHDHLQAEAAEPVPREESVPAEVEEAAREADAQVQEQLSVVREEEAVASLLEGAEELFELADFTGSLELVEKALELRPADPKALEYLSKNQETLIQMYESKLGRMDRKPRLAIAPDEVVWLNLDHRAGFLLSQIDGTLTVDDLYALSGMGRLETSRILAQLIEEGVVSFE